MKSKVESMLATLNEICNRLICYNVLSLIRANSDLLYAACCPIKVFTLTYKMFQQLIKPIFSENAANKRNAEVYVYKYFYSIDKALYTSKLILGLKGSSKDVGR